ncbi:MAG: tat pathway signal sequence domain protein [Nitrospira sp. SG-bin1]|nr:MAG: tat pathway signal sequence domain protein [Nitrospira sp. SG-bin1]
MLKRYVIFIFVTIWHLTPFNINVYAGEFFQRNGLAIDGYDPVAYFTEMKPVKGSPEFRSDYQGATFQFASAAHRDTFVANPEKFAPQYGGYCAYGMAKGYKAKIDPVAFSVVRDKLYLNYNETIRARWLSDIPGYIQKADTNWPEVQQHTKVQE